MIYKCVLIVCFFGLTGFLQAKANYSLACSMNGSTAKVFACNSGDSAEGNNEYTNVKACTGSDCDTEYSLMYVYASSGDCDEIGTISFSENKEFCAAWFRP